MNLTIRGIKYDLGEHPADTLHTDLHAELEADYVLSNPPFNISDWGQSKLLDDERWQYGVPPRNNANWAWVQHIISHLAPTGVAGFVLANGALSAANQQEMELRRSLVEADLVDCILMLPSHLFYTTQIAASIWILAKDKSAQSFRDRKGETLFIHAERLGSMSDKTHRELSHEEIQQIAGVYHLWRSANSAYQDVLGFSKSVTQSELTQHKWSFVPGRYVGFDRTQRPELNRDKMRQEIELVEERLVEASLVSENLLSTLRSIVNG